MNTLGKREISTDEKKELLKVLKNRFEKNMNRHLGIEWANVQAKLDSNTDKI